MPTATPTSVPTATPTSIPTATPTSVPTATPTSIPTATPMSVPTATPTARPTETPESAYSSVWRSLTDVSLLEQERPALASAITSLSWVADGINRSELQVVQDLVDLALTDESTFVALVDKPWVVDRSDQSVDSVIEGLVQLAGHDERPAQLLVNMPFLDTLEPSDVEVLGYLLALSRSSIPAIEALLAKVWVGDGIDESESAVMTSLAEFATRDEAAVLRILESPLLETVETSDTELLWALQRVWDTSVDAFEDLISKSWIEDGLDESESAVITRLIEVAKRDEAAALAILEMPFLEAIDSDDVATLDSLVAVADHGPTLLGRVANATWIADGLDATEAGLIRELGWITMGDEAVALKLIEMPFLRTAELIGDSEALAVNALWALGAYSQEALATLIERKWVEDGFDESEYVAVRNLGWIASRDKSAALRILEMPFLETVEPSDRLAIEALQSLSQSSSQTLETLLAMPWVEDGLDDSERAVATRLGEIAKRDEEAAVGILEMPFLETVEPSDAGAIASLRHLVAENPGQFRDFLAHPTLRGGITDEWIDVVIVSPVVDFVPDLFTSLLDPSIVAVEKRTIVLPLAGEIDLAIVRTSPGSEVSMNVLERSLLNAERFMEAALPVGYVTLLYEDGIPLAGYNAFAYMVIYSEFDDVYGGAIEHEVSHYYWRENHQWIDEGAATFMTRVLTEDRPDRWAEPLWPPFRVATHLSEVEQLLREGTDRPHFFMGSYVLGDRIFSDLYRTLGEDAFWEGFRNLYRLSQGVTAGIGELNTAFNVAAPDNVDDVEAIAARWYHGNAPYDTSYQDTLPADSSLPDFNGKLDGAYIALTEDGPPIEQFSVKVLTDRVWLTLEYSYRRGPGPLIFEIVEYFEDGFVFRRRDVTVATPPDRTNHVYRLPVGVSEGVFGRWDQFALWRYSPGRYWVHVYHEGRKLADVTYEATP